MNGRPGSADGGAVNVINSAAQRTSAPVRKLTLEKGESVLCATSWRLVDPSFRMERTRQLPVGDDQQHLFSTWPDHPLTSHASMTSTHASENSRAPCWKKSKVIVRISRKYASGSQA